MTTPQVPQRDAAAPPLPRAVAKLVAHLSVDGWTHEVTDAAGPASFGALAEGQDGHRHHVEVVEDVDSACLRARHDDGRRLVAVWVRRPGKGWALDQAWRWPWPWETAIPRQLTATALVAYVVEGPPADPREVEREAQRLAADLAELARYRAMWAANQDVWVPVPRTWTSIQPGEVMLDPGRLAWSVVAVTPAQDGPIVRLRHGEHEYAGRPPIATTLVLVPVPVRDALTLLRSELGSRIMDAGRKTA